MWYGKEESICRDQAIFAENSNGEVFVLLPQVGKLYVNTGFNWFNIKTGSYNSCSFFKTVEEALYSYRSYRIYNGNLMVGKLLEK